MVILIILCFINYVSAQTNTFPSSGNAGVGTTAPGQLFEVKNGNINIDLSGTSSNAYMINGQSVLWHNNNVENIFVGVNAGNANLTNKL